MTPDTIPPDVDALFRKALRQAKAKGYAEGFAAAESQIVYGLRTVARLNGSGEAVLKSVASADLLPRLAEAVGERVTKAITHAPAGGVTLNGKDFRGGQFIPAADLKNATPKEKAELQQKHDAQQKGPAGSGQYGEWGRAAGGEGEGEGKKKPHEMTKEEFEAELAKQDTKQFGDTYEVDWGSGRGQGKRVGQGGVVGGMSAAPKGKKTYTDPFAKLGMTDQQRATVNLQDQASGGMDRYLQARSMGLDHDDAFAVMIPDDEGGGHSVLVNKYAPPESAPPHTPDSAHALVRKLMAPNGPPTADTVKQLHAAFAGMSKKDLQELKGRLGIKAAGPQAELARKLAERAAQTDRSNRNQFVNERVSVDDAHAKIMELRDSGDLATPAGVRQVADLIAGGMTGDELKELKARLGVKASGAKAELARKLVERGRTVKQKGAEKQAEPAVEAVQEGAAVKQDASAARAIPPESLVKHHLEELLRERHHGTGSVPAEEIQAAVGDGVDAKAVLNDLRRSGQVRMVEDDKGGYVVETTDQFRKVSDADRPPSTLQPHPPPEELKAAVSGMVAAAITDGRHEGGMVPIHQIRAEIKAKFGDGAASHKVLDEVLHDMRRSGEAGLIPIDNRSRATEDQLRDSITAPVGLLYYLETGANFKPPAGGAAGGGSAGTVGQPGAGKPGAGKPATPPPTPDNPTAPLTVPQIVAKIREIDERSPGGKMTLGDRLDRSE